MSFLLMDLQGAKMTPKEAQMLQHKAVAGIILFSRNFEDKQQLINLVRAVRNVRHNLLITVDHEGGRVQRFHQDFTYIPPMCQILDSAQGDITQAAKWAHEIGWLMASELLEVGIDMTFAPVLDRDGVSDVIGQRAFSEKVQNITPVARALIEGLAQAGMKCCGKHFPGHGSVQADTHFDTAIDSRAYEEIERIDMMPFHDLIQENKLDAIMPAHVVFSAVDPQPTGFSSIWLQDILKRKLQFNGIVFSDDLSMAAAQSVGDPADRIDHALHAGCDLVLLCNDPQSVEQVLQHYTWPEISDQPLSHQLCSSHLFSEITDATRHKKAQDLCVKLQQDFVNASTYTA
tara:strand:+ start:4702 stop:5736 length:1035 start_codon:yes stop_codon:yes gene_type:complete